MKDRMIIEEQNTAFPMLKNPNDNWIELDINNLPNEEVLIAAFSDYSEFYGAKIVGYVEVQKGIIVGFSSYNVDTLRHCTHYCSIPKELPG